MRRASPLPRFLLFVLLPALVTCAGLIRMAQEGREARRDATMSRVGGLLSTAVQSELAEAWRMLEVEAAPLSSLDTSLVAVRRALTGDTVRSLGSDPDGPRVSVLLPRSDTLVSATGIVRSPTLASLPGAGPFRAGLYLRGVRIQPPIDRASATEPEGARGEASLPANLDAGPGRNGGWNAGWNEAAGVWVSPATASLGSAAGELVVAVRPQGRRRGVASARTLIAATGLLLLGSVLVSAGSSPGRSRPSRSGPGRPGPGTRRADARSGGLVVAGLVLVTLTTGVVAGWVALGETRIAKVDGVRELETAAGLVGARGLLRDPAAAQRWLGSAVYRVESDRLLAPADQPPPAMLATLPTPEPGRPASGTTPDGRRWHVVTSGEGRTIFLGDPMRTRPLLPLALGGTLVVLLGSIAVVRPTSGGVVPATSVSGADDVS